MKRADSNSSSIGWSARTMLRAFAEPSIAESFVGDLVEEANIRVSSGHKVTSVRRWMRFEALKAAPRFAWMSFVEGGSQAIRSRVFATLIVASLQLVIERVIGYPSWFELAVWQVLWQSSLLLGLLCVRDRTTYVLAMSLWLTGGIALSLVLSSRSTA